MLVEELIKSFDLARLTKSNSLFDRRKLLSFNTEHIRMMPHDHLAGHFRDYLKAIGSPVAAADDRLLSKLIKVCEGARTLADIERKTKFLFIPNEKIEYDQNAVQKVLIKDGGLAILPIIRDKLAAMDRPSEQAIEDMLRSLAEEKGVGLGKIAQPLRVAITGTTISPPIFDSVEMLGKEKTLARINITLKKFGTES
jgi:glutamyl-tRNA synthetase